MSLETRYNDDQSHLTIFMDEKFDFGKVQDFRQSYGDLPASVKTITVDLANTEYMDSSALGMLLNMQKSLQGKVSNFAISHCRPQVAKILKISRFDKKFSIS
ncbi:STAS domain-containing protein [Aestuariibacter halophilus]|uniref:STAS domain-containing protein n=1 Tax=Fluctibacter halophilus TaxID=226011 RepID=A0ABS8G3Q8_9ALTE|nr:STAS domain-containing protein [Aestuariibacter halophilus]MCC2615200.1 STAS domain-containing protein [Aestuariibacter halophilus]